MKTILIFDQCGDAPIQFAVLQGDYSRFSKVYIGTNSDDESEVALQDELYDLMYDSKGKLKVDMYQTFPINSFDLNTAVVVCGFVS